MKTFKILFITALATIVLAACNNTTEEKDNGKMDSGSKSGMMKEKSDKEMTATFMGDFKGESGHTVSGKTKIKDGKLMLTDFKTDEGPDLHVYLSKGTDVKDAKEISKIDLKESEQTFDLAGIDVEKYDTVLIYCDKAHELFGSAMYSDKTADMMGNFKGLNDKKVTGIVTLNDNKLMLSDFSTDKGPDLHVYLVKNDKIESGVSLGKVDLKNKEQSFSIPKDINLKDYKKVVIYCDEAHVMFGEAVL